MSGSILKQVSEFRHLGYDIITSRSGSAEICIKSGLGKMYGACSSVMAIPRCNNFRRRWGLIKTFSFCHVDYLLQMTPFLKLSQMSMIEVAIRKLSRCALNLHPSTSNVLTALVSGTTNVFARAAQLQTRLIYMPTWENAHYREVLERRRNGEVALTAARTVNFQILEQMNTQQYTERARILLALLHSSDAISKTLTRTISTPTELHMYT